MTNNFRISVIVALALAFIVTGLLGGPENLFDIQAIQSLAEIRHAEPQLTSFAVILTQLGSVYGTLGIGAAASLWLLFRGERGKAALLAGTVVVERLILDGLKIIVGRPRPLFDEHPVITHSSSFPSGHSANSMAVFVAVALIAAPSAYRRPALFAAVALGLLVGATRPYLGVHWPSDVIGGWSLGLLIVFAALALGRRTGLMELEAKHDVVGGHRSPVHQGEAK